MRFNLASIKTQWLRLQFRRADQLAFLGVFYRLMAEGVAPRDVLERMEQASDPLWQFAANAAWVQLNQGKQISEAFKAICDEDICEVLRAPEQSGNYAVRATEAIESLQKDQTNHGTWMGIVAQPAAYIALVLASYAGMLFDNLNVAPGVRA